MYPSIEKHREVAANSRKNFPAEKLPRIGVVRGNGFSLANDIDDFIECRAVVPQE
jgi:hypothetical protein